MRLVSGMVSKQGGVLRRVAAEQRACAHVLQLRICHCVLCIWPIRNPLEAHNKLEVCIGSDAFLYRLITKRRILSIEVI